MLHTKATCIVQYGIPVHTLGYASERNWFYGHQIKSASSIIILQTRTFTSSLVEAELAKEKARRQKAQLIRGTRHSSFGGTFVVKNQKSISGKERVYHRPLAGTPHCLSGERKRDSACMWISVQSNLGVEPRLFFFFSTVGGLSFYTEP